MTSQQSQHEETAGQPKLLVRGQDGSTYAIPEDVVEGFRLTDEQTAKAEAALPAREDDVEGFQYIGQFKMTGPYYIFGYVIHGMEDTWRPRTDYYPPLH